VQTRVGVLREEIRRQIVPVVVVEQIALMLGHQSDQALERLRTLCELDPEMPMFHYMLAGTLLTAGRLDEAAAAADEGLRSCGDGAAGDDGVQGLHDIRREIRRRRLLKEMEPARKQYRKGKFGKAHSELQRLAPDSRGDPLWTTFDNFVQELEARGVRFSRRNGSGLASVAPQGTFKDVDALHFLLVGEEIGKAKTHLAGGRPDKAESEIDDAMRYAPSFPYAHFLKARCMYQRLGERLGSGKMPALEEAIAQLEAARAHAQFATQDPDLTDTNLLEAIDGALEAVRHVEQELKLVAEDAKLLNPVVDDFHALMKSANEGISGPDDFDKIDRRLKSLEDRVKSRDLKSRMKSETGARMLAEFTKVLEANRKQLEEIRPQLAEAKVVNALQKEFMSIMGSASGGVASYELPGIKSRLEKLMKDINSALPMVKSPAGQNALFELAKAVQRNLDQVATLM
jgi:tetratricopeptide (TPR) repeat protein